MERIIFQLFLVFLVSILSMKEAAISHYNYDNCYKGRTCAYQGVRKAIFLENFAKILNE